MADDDRAEADAAEHGCGDRRERLRLACVHELTDVKFCSRTIKDACPPPPRSRRREPALPRATDDEAGNDQSLEEAERLRREVVLSEPVDAEEDPARDPDAAGVTRQAAEAEHE